MYTEAARTLLGGDDPWAPTSSAIAFAAPPPSLLPYLPMAWLPDALIRPVWVAIASISAIYSVRRLQLPAWWLLFPPVAHGIATGGTALPVLALLVSGGAVARAAGIVARVYAAVPIIILGRWRSLAVAGALLLATAPFVGWPAYIQDLDRIAGLLVSQSEGGMSVASVPILVPFAALSLIVLGRRRAAWLLVPVLWPNTQLHYAVIALPALASTPLLAAALTVPGAPLAVAVGIMAQAAYERLLAMVGRLSRTAIGDPRPTM